MPSLDAAFLVVLVGPTAVGKSEIAIRIAKLIDGEIISADSRLFYRGMDIGTAKPTLEERSHIPHHMIDIANPDEIWSVARYQEEVNKLINEIRLRGKTPILVGGTGQFIRAIVEGWQIPEQIVDQSLRNVIENWAREIGAKELHLKLSLIDPQAAAIIEPNNLRRTIRALEVIFTTGQRFSALRQKHQPNFHYCMIGLFRPRAELFARVDQRIKEMLARGFVEEVQALLSENYSPELPSLSAIGYKEIIGVLNGSLSLSEAELIIQRNTRRFIRRQANWFKLADPKIAWFDVSDNKIGTIIAHIERVRRSILETSEIE